MIKGRIPETVFPVGRLDKLTTGLMIFTNDGNYANEILHPKFEIVKTYRVTLDKPVTKRDLKRLTSGVILEDGPFKFEDIAYISPKIYIVHLL